MWNTWKTRFGYFVSHQALTSYVHSFLRLSFVYLAGMSRQVRRSSFQDRSHQALCHKINWAAWSNLSTGGWQEGITLWIILQCASCGPNGLVCFMLHNFHVYETFSSEPWIILLAWTIAENCLWSLSVLGWNAPCTIYYGRWLGEMLIKVCPT